MDLTSEEWEVATNFMKYHRWRTQGSHIAACRKLSTIAEIQACLTCRPLCAVSSESLNPICLLDIWWTTDPITCADYTNVTCKGLSRWQTYQQQVQQFWQTWSSDHPQSLQQRQRWYRTSCDLKPGEVDPLREDNTSSLQWPTAVITKTHLGKKWFSAGSYSQRPQRTFRRPTTKRCPHRVQKKL